MELVTPGFGLIFWQTITFLLVLFVLGKYAWKPIMMALEDRESSIENALKEAEKVKELMEKEKATQVQLLDEARLEREKILKAANKVAQETKDAAKEKAVTEATKIVEDARKTIEAEKQAAITEIKSQIAVLSVDVAETLLKRELEDKEKQKQLAVDLVKDLNVN